MHQNAFAPPGPAGGAYNALPHPLAELRGRERGRREAEVEGRGRGNEERGGPPMFEVR